MQIKHCLALVTTALLSTYTLAQIPALSASTAESTLRVIEQGNINGFIADNGAMVWRGLPFAASPDGQRRWRAPRRAQAWKGLRSAVDFSEPCPQFSREEDKHEKVIGSEDCLYLNVYAPANAVGKDLPVMLWIHGGGNVWGRSSDYNGANLAQNENVIIVTVQYRLGPLGFFANTALRETAQITADRAANFALLDLIAALTWVQKNINVFGGNTDNVTIFGESAGGHNVAALLGSPLATGLFHRAIIQSGGFDSTSLAQAENENSRYFNPSSIVLKKLGITQDTHTAKVAQLQTKTLQEIFAVYTSADDKTNTSVRFGSDSNTYINMPLVISDGITLPVTPLRQLFSSRKTFNNVPLITGSNRDELKLFFSADPGLIEKKMLLFPMPKNQQQYDLLAEYGSRLWRIHSVDQPAAQMAGAGHTDVWAYRFDWDESGSVGLTDLSKLLGAAHAFEIPFVFNEFEEFFIDTKMVFPEKNKDSRHRLSLAMGAYWASFARNGYPGKQRGLTWPTYTGLSKINSPTLMRFDSDEDAGIGLITGADSITKLVTDLLADKRVEDKHRCILLKDIKPSDSREANLNPLSAELYAQVKTTCSSS